MRQSQTSTRSVMPRDCELQTYCESPGSTAAHADCASSRRSSPYMTPAPLRRRKRGCGCWLFEMITRDTQIPVTSADGLRRYYLDMGWDDLMLALEYDGEHHRLNPDQYRYDIQRSEDLYELGWTRVRVVKTNTSADILRRLARAWRSRLRPDRENF